MYMKMINDESLVCNRVFIMMDGYVKKIFLYRRGNVFNNNLIFYNIVQYNDKLKRLQLYFTEVNYLGKVNKTSRFRQYFSQR